MNERHGELLCGIVAEYIRTASPVGSAKLTRSLNLSISSATVRSTLQELNELGYVYQPHTSAGRIPTDRGYRYYIDHGINTRLAHPERQRVQNTFSQLLDDFVPNSRTATKTLAKLAHTVVVSAALASSDVYEAGMAELLNELEEGELDTAREVSLIIDEVGNHAPQLARMAQEQTVVLIGQEIPFLNAHHTSILIKQTQLSGSPVLLVITGRKRMSYQRNLALLNYVADLLN